MTSANSVRSMRAIPLSVRLVRLLIAVANVLHSASVAVGEMFVTVLPTIFELSVLMLLMMSEVLTAMIHSPPQVKSISVTVATSYFAATMPLK